MFLKVTINSKFTLEKHINPYFYDVFREYRNATLGVYGLLSFAGNTIKNATFIKDVSNTWIQRKDFRCYIWFLFFLSLIAVLLCGYSMRRNGLWKSQHRHLDFFLINSSILDLSKMVSNVDNNIFFEFVTEKTY